LNKEKAVLKWLFVRPEARGNGIGSRLLQRAISHAREIGYRILVLCTMNRMEAAHRLYGKAGFEFKQAVTFWGRPMQMYERCLSASVPDSDPAELVDV
jgi:GNAT superfamily N-acetyltransferase